jgi:hypothetical protein
VQYHSVTEMLRLGQQSCSYASLFGKL